MPLNRGLCAACGLDLNGESGIKLRAVSLEAIDALRRREHILQEATRANIEAPTVPAPVTKAPSLPAPDKQPIPPQQSPALPAINRPAPPLTKQTASPWAPQPMYHGPRPPGQLAPQPESNRNASSSLGIQNVLAVSGAGLLAIAAIVFSFFTWNLMTLALRSGVIAGLTGLFIAGTVLLERRRLRVSAESFAAVTIALLLLDVWAISALNLHANIGLVGYVAISSLTIGGILLALGLLTRLRVWHYSGVVALAAAPGIIGIASSTMLGLVAGSVGTFLATCLWPHVETRLGEKMKVALTAESVTLTIFAAGSMCVGLIATPLSLGSRISPSLPEYMLAPMILGFAGLAYLAARPRHSRPWAYLAGLLFATGFMLIAFNEPDGVTELFGSSYPGVYFAVYPILAVLALGILCTRTARGLARASSIRNGAWTVLIVASIPGIWVLFESTLTGVILRSAGGMFASEHRSAPSPDERWAVSSIVHTEKFAWMGVFGMIALIVFGAGALLISRYAPMSETVALEPPSESDPEHNATALSAQPAYLPANQATSPLNSLRQTAQVLASLSLAAAICALPFMPGLLDITRAILGLTVATALAGYAKYAHLLKPAVPGTSFTNRIRTALAASSKPAKGQPGVIRPRIYAVWTAHIVIMLTIMVSLNSPLLMIGIGVPLIALVIIILRPAMPARIRHLYVGAGYGYALILWTVGASQLGFEGIPLLCVVTVAASIVAIIVTALRRVDARSWWAVLVVTLIPFLLGVASVLMARSGWTAASTAITFVLVLVLTFRDRPGMTPFLRASAAALLMPTIAVTLVCLGAAAITGSASVVVLPVIALAVALTLPFTRQLGLLASPKAEGRESKTVALAIELSCLVTGGIAVGLAIERAAAGWLTAFIVCFILGIGVAIAAQVQHRGRLWWFAAALWTGALWSLLLLGSVGLPEAYIAPPAIAAMIVGLVFGRKHTSLFTLYSTGFIAITGLTGILAINGPTIPAIVELFGRGFPIRACIMVVVAATTMLIVALSASTKPSWWQMPQELRRVSLLVAGWGMTVAIAQAIRYGQWFDRPFGIEHQSAAIFVPVLTWTAIAFSGFLYFGRLWRRQPVSGKNTPSSPDTYSPVWPISTRPKWITSGRWAYLPAVAATAIGPISAVHGLYDRAQFAIPIILIMMTIEIALLFFMVLTANRQIHRKVSAPPVWIIFVVAVSAAIAGWSTRELRVEVFSIPLGIGLILVGYLTLRAESKTSQLPGGLTTWPVGCSGSWRILGPGLLALIGPSMMATGTDPLTWRAIMVIAIALAMILIGAQQRLAAPFTLGVIALIVENVTVFAVQIGRSIGAMPWWITLATAGAVLLVIAVTYERRITNLRSAAAYVKDLR